MHVRAANHTPHPDLIWRASDKGMSLSRTTLGGRWAPPCSFLAAVGENRGARAGKALAGRDCQLP
ncbi:hypothetical protein J2X04_000957 [Lysobacter niabensis]|uniref:Uncharacterized protein n=1 Tax=Agrilutibacter niabensis TaxID=380628 RepID=A0ABU1VMP3_9GAMM|nr:hypothetical protein [Lysobacter niabensis]